MRRKRTIGIIVGLMVVVFVGLPAKVEAADYNVKADSPVSVIVKGKDVTFDWHLRTGVTQTKIELHTSAGKPKILYTSDTQYTWTDFPYGYGWWWVKVFRKGVFNDYKWYGQTSPKHFYLSPNEPKKPQYLPEYDSKRRILFFETQRDYTITLSDYFWNSEKLPDCCEHEANFYLLWADRSLPPCDWDFIRLEEKGILTIKQGYRWDGASYPCKNLGSSSCIDATFNIRSSLVHDALYDLMRMEYLDSDSLGKRPNGTYNRKMADMILYMIAMEEGQPKKNFQANWPLRNDGADSDYNSMRTWGAGATHDVTRLAWWKFHVSELTANASDEKVELKWRPANYSGKDPLLLVHFYKHLYKHLGYYVQRDGKRIATVRPSVTSYIDDNVDDGNTYSYTIRPHKDNTNQYDWSNTVQVTVSNVAPTVDAGPDATINKGDTFTNSGFFTDPGADTWTATVDYGDGSGVQSLSLTGKTFSLSHVYADNGVYTVNVTVTDDDGGVGTDTAQVTVSNVAPTVDAGPDATINEGDTFTSSGSFTDPGADTWTATVDYGDGSGVQSLSLTGKTFSLSHVYADNGVYTVTVIVDSNDGDQGADATVVTAEKIAPVVNAGPDTSFSSGQAFHISAGFNDPGVNDNPWAFMIDWGDGSPIATGSSDFQGANTVTGDHQYLTPGTYTVIVTITDKDGGIGTDTLQVEVESTLLPRFTVTDLTINPEIIEVGDSIDITVIVANTGNLTGSHEVSLLIDDVLEQVQEVTLDSGESEPVIFTISPDTMGTYTVDIDGLSGSFVVKEIAPTPVEEEKMPTPTPAPEPIPTPITEPEPTPEQVPKPATNWLTIIGIVVGITIVGLASYYFIRKKRKTV